VAIEFVVAHRIGPISLPGHDVDLPLRQQQLLLMKLTMLDAKMRHCSLIESSGIAFEQTNQSVERMFASCHRHGFDNKKR
jgi:hypothetical protein